FFMAHVLSKIAASKYDVLIQTLEIQLNTFPLLVGKVTLNRNSNIPPTDMLTMLEDYFEAVNETLDKFSDEEILDLQKSVQTILQETETKLPGLKTNLDAFRKLMLCLIGDKIYYQLLLAVGSLVGFKEAVPQEIIDNIKKISEKLIKYNQTFSVEQREKVIKIKRLLDDAQFIDPDNLRQLLVSVKIFREYTFLMDTFNIITQQNNYLSYFTTSFSDPFELTHRLTIEISSHDPLLAYSNMIKQMQALKTAHPSLTESFDKILKCILVAVARFIDFSAPPPDPKNPHDPQDPQAYRLMISAYQYFFPDVRQAQQQVSSDIINSFVMTTYQEVKGVNLRELFEATARKIEDLDKGLATNADKFLSHYKQLELFIADYKTPKKIRLVEDLKQREERILAAIEYLEFFCTELDLEMKYRGEEIRAKKALISEVDPVPPTELAAAIPKPKKPSKQKKSANNDRPTPLASDKQTAISSPSLADSNSNIVEPVEPAETKKIKWDVNAKEFVPSSHLSVQPSAAIQTMPIAPSSTPAAARSKIRPLYAQRPIAPQPPAAAQTMPIAPSTPAAVRPKIRPPYAQRPIAPQPVPNYLPINGGFFPGYVPYPNAGSLLHNSSPNYVYGYQYPHLAIQPGQVSGPVPGYYPPTPHSYGNGNARPY
ncbi:MAG: hypothetical protein ACHP9Y_02675, partial [Gammaproteobacteria bacterium]